MGAFLRHSPHFPAAGTTQRAEIDAGFGRVCRALDDQSQSTPPAAPSMLEINNGGTFWTVW
jgi:hypothetical protein